MAINQSAVVSGTYFILSGCIPHVLELLSVTNMMSGMIGMKQQSRETQHQHLMRVWPVIWIIKCPEEKRNRFIFIAVIEGKKCTFFIDIYI